jgi:multidrug efflux pump subunit AcrA (membrane-fusion protein)
MGGQKVVFVARDDSTFVPRAVQVRSVGGNLLEVLGGIEPGERIVGRGAFLVKSQASKSELGEE